LNLLIHVAGGKEVLKRLQSAKIARRREPTTAKPKVVLYLCVCQDEIYILEIHMKQHVQLKSESSCETELFELAFEGVLHVDELTPDCILTQLHTSQAICLGDIERLAVDSIASPPGSARSSQPASRNSRVSSAASAISAASNVSDSSLPSVIRSIPRCLSIEEEDVEKHFRKIQSNRSLSRLPSGAASDSESEGQDANERIPSFHMFGGMSPSRPKSTRPKSVVIIPSENAAQSTHITAEKKRDTDRVLTASARCFKCQKKLTYGGSVFRCKCSHVFCTAHRYSDKHECQYDYKSKKVQPEVPSSSSSVSLKKVY
jgi:hypothetical protein